MSTVRKIRQSATKWRTCAGFAASLLWSATSPAFATTIYESVAADGTRRFADQPLDATYRPLAVASPSDTPITAALVRGVVAIESGGNTKAVSPKGARGLMQLMPATASQYGVPAHALHDPAVNLRTGTAHLQHLLKLHDGNVALALAAYNAGAGAVARHGQRIPPYRETMLYVPAVLARASQP